MNQEQFEELKADYIKVQEAIQLAAEKWGVDPDLTDEQKAELENISNAYEEKLDLLLGDEYN